MYRSSLVSQTLFGGLRQSSWGSVFSAGITGPDYRTCATNVIGGIGDAGSRFAETFYNQKAAARLPHSKSWRRGAVLPNSQKRLECAAPPALSLSTSGFQRSDRAV